MDCNEVKCSSIRSYFRGKEAALGRIKAYGPARTQPIIGAFEVICTGYHHYLVQFDGDDILCVEPYDPPSVPDCYPRLW